LTDEYRPSKVRSGRIKETALEYIVGQEAGPVMSTISSKNQITLPAHLLRELGLTAGDRLAVSREGSRLVLRPRPRDWVSYHAGSLRGVYGSREAIDAYVEELRQDDERSRSIEEAWTGRRPAPED
jgi:AbrB family looped-hinge helix DNA binding protein